MSSRDCDTNHLQLHSVSVDEAVSAQGRITSIVDRLGALDSGDILLFKFGRLILDLSDSYLRTQPFPEKKAVGQAPHLPRGLTQRLWGNASLPIRTSVAAESMV